MPLDVVRALREAADRVLTPTGAQVTGLFVVMNLVTITAFGSLSRAIVDRLVAGLPPESTPPPEATAPPALSVELPLWLAGVAALAALAVSALGSMAALRAIHAGDGLRAEQFTRDVVWVGGNLLVGGLVYGVFFLLGSALFVLPGLFVLSTLYLWTVYTAVEGQGFLEAFRSSWQATASDADPDAGLLRRYVTGSNRVRVLVVALVAGVVAGGLGAAVGVPLELALGDGPGATLLGTVPSSLGAVFSLATLVAVHGQLDAAA